MDRAGADAPALRRIHTADLSADLRADIRALLLRAFDSGFSDDDWDHALGGVHIVCVRGGVVVGHAAVVQRQLIVGDDVYRVGYVEAVAVDAELRRQGVGRLLMAAVEDVITSAYDFGALSASEDGLPLYRGRGWQTWIGPLHALGGNGRTSTPDDSGSVMVFGEPIGTGRVALSADLTADLRRGDSW